MLKPAAVTISQTIKQNLINVARKRNIYIKMKKTNGKKMSRLKSPKPSPQSLLEDRISDRAGQSYKWHIFRQC